MAALGMQGEHHVNTFLYQKKKTKSVRTLSFLASLFPLFDTLLATATSKLKQVNRTKSRTPMVKQCNAKPGPFKNVKEEIEETELLPAKWRVRSREEIA